MEVAQLKKQVKQKRKAALNSSGIGTGVKACVWVWVCGCVLLQVWCDDVLLEE